MAKKNEAIRKHYEKNIKTPPAKKVKKEKEIIGGVIFEKTKSKEENKEEKVVNLEDMRFVNEDYNDLPSDFVIHSQWSQTTRSQPRTGEKQDPRSITVPGESMTVKEILKRHASGRPIPAGRMPIYDSDQELRIPDLEKLDKMQIEDLKRQLDEAQAEKQRQAKVIEEELAKEKEEKYKQMEMQFEKLQKDYETIKKFENENNKNIS